MSNSNAANNKAIVLEAMDTLFNKRDFEKAKTFWSPNYIQHSAIIDPGRDGLFNLIKGLPKSGYENDLIVAEGDYVIMHNRYQTGEGANLIGADIFRIESGVLAEHWDVLQSEVSSKESKSGNPMFGKKFPGEK